MNKLVEMLGYSYFIDEDCVITIHSQGNVLWVLKNLTQIYKKHGPYLGRYLLIPLRKKLNRITMFDSNTFDRIQTDNGFYTLRIDL
jgi:hypothetical protein